MIKNIFLKSIFNIFKTYINLHNDLPFLPERMEIGKVEKLGCSLTDKKDYALHKRTLKRAVNHGLVLKKWHRVIKFNQKS